MNPLKGNTRMTKKDVTFSKLVQDIDKKWGHTYEDPPEEPDHVWELLITLPLNDKANKQEE